MKTIYSILLAIFFALLSYFYLRLRVSPEPSFEKVKEKSTEPKKKENSKVKINPFVSEVKQPVTKKLDDFLDFDFGEYADEWNEVKKHNCVDECGKTTEMFNKYWEIRNEYDMKKYGVKIEEPFTTRNIDYVEIVMNSNETVDEMKKILWQSEVSQGNGEGFSNEVDDLFTMLQQQVEIMEKMKVMLSERCLPCITTKAFESIHDDELRELNAFKTVLKYAKRK